jgi:hypothetical protein
MANMRYPYTFGAMVRNFPLKYHIQKNWHYKAYVLGLLISAPLFLKITTSFPAEANVWSPFTMGRIKKDH